MLAAITAAYPVLAATVSGVGRGSDRPLFDAPAGQLADPIKAPIPAPKTASGVDRKNHSFCTGHIALQAPGRRLENGQDCDQRAKDHTKDPSGFADSINLYAFARSNPVNHRDPTGRDTWDSLAGFSIGYFNGMAIVLAMMNSPGDDADAQAKNLDSVVFRPGQGVWSSKKLDDEDFRRGVDIGQIAGSWTAVLAPGARRAPKAEGAPATVRTAAARPEVSGSADVGAPSASPAPSVVQQPSGSPSVVFRGTVPYQGARSAQSAVEGFARSVQARCEGKQPPTMSTAIMDTESGEVCFGLSGRPPPNLLSLEFAARSPPQSLERWPITNCAEVKPAIQFDLKGVPRSRLVGHTVRTKTLEPEACCANCDLTTEGIRWTSAKD